MIVSGTSRCEWGESSGRSYPKRLGRDPQTKSSQAGVGAAAWEEILANYPLPQPPPEMSRGWAGTAPPPWSVSPGVTIHFWKLFWNSVPVGFKNYYYYYYYTILISRLLLLLIFLVIFTRKKYYFPDGIGCPLWCQGFDWGGFFARALGWREAPGLTHPGKLDGARATLCPTVSQCPPWLSPASVAVVGYVAARDAWAPLQPLTSQIVQEAACLLIQVRNGSGYILNATNCF